MQLDRIRLVNFRQHAETELVLGPGITAIVGPNGSGKTTLLEAIAWAFYGNPAARGGRDSIRRYGAPARAQVRVEVDFTLGAHEFRVVRGLYGAELFQDGQEAPIVTSQQEVTTRLTRVLGMTRDEFFNTYFTGQKELAVMAAMGPTERARFLSRVLGYDKLKLAQDRLRETRSRQKGELAGLEQGLGDAKQLTADRELALRVVAQASERVDAASESKSCAKGTLESEGPVWTRMVQVRESVLSLDSDTRVAERDVQEARREFQRLDRELAGALAAKTRSDSIAAELARIRDLTEEIEQLERDAVAAGRRRLLAGQLGEIAEQDRRVGQRLEELGDPVAALAGARTELDALRQALQHAEADEQKAHTAWIRDKQDAETKRQALRDQYRDLQKHRDGIVEQGPDGKCPTCARPLESEYETVLSSLERQLEEIEIDGKYFKRRLAQLAGEPEEVEHSRHDTMQLTQRVEAAVQVVARCESRVRDAAEIEAELRLLQSRMAALAREVEQLPDSYKADRHEEVRAELRGLEPMMKEAMELQVRADRAERLVREAELAEKALSEVEARFGRLKTAMRELGFSEERFVEVRERYEAAEAAFRETELELASVQGDLKVAQAAREQAQRRISERESRVGRIRQIQNELRLHDELDRAFSDLRLELNAAMRPEIAERASAFLSDLTDGRYSELELDDHYRILVIEDGVPKSVISGGEEDVANLVLRLAISQMVAERAGQPLSLLVLDEIFGSLDENRRLQVVDLLRRLAGRFPQVVLITHIESVRDGVDRVLRVEFDPRRGISLVTEDEGVLAP